MPDAAAMRGVSLILYVNAGPLDTTAALRAAKPERAALPNVTLLEVP